MDTLHIPEGTSPFHSENINPDGNYLQPYTANSSYYALNFFIDNVHKSNDLFIIRINCRSWNANFTDL